MRAVVTRVTEASVKINEAICGSIGQGLLILLGVGPEDTPAHCQKLADKILGLRIFEDDDGKMNREPCRCRRPGPGRQPIYPLRQLPQGPPPQLCRRSRA